MNHYKTTLIYFTLTNLLIGVGAGMAFDLKFGVLLFMIGFWWSVIFLMLAETKDILEAQKK